MLAFFKETNHTFWCNGTGLGIHWFVNGIRVYPSKLEVSSNLMIVDFNYPIDDGCVKESSVTIHALTTPEFNTLATFSIQCIILNDRDSAVISYAHLNVHGKVCLFHVNQCT